MEEDYNLIQNQFNRIISLVLTWMLPIIVVLVAFFLIASIIFFISIGILKSQQNDALALSITSSNGYNLLPVLPQKFLVVGGQNYTEPLLQDLNKTQKLALQTIRIAEWGNRSESSLDGDRDSCGPYQQRLYELGNQDLPLGKKSKEILGAAYQSIFHQSRIELFKQFYNGNIRQGLTLTSGYGNRYLFGFDFHYGLDYGYKKGYPVSAVENGKVLDVTYDLMGGNTVVIEHKNQELQSIYAHLDQALVEKGTEVVQGGIIGISGNTGLATSGEHLHYQLKKNVESGWNSDTIDPNTQAYYLNLIRTPFLNTCLQLTKVHLATGFFDSIALERLGDEMIVKPWLEKEITTENYSQFINALCLSQRPESCPVWEARVKNIIPNPKLN
jgi:murein DD-endopeptidase MepM/ murein hydrolase activator NlpD